MINNILPLQEIFTGSNYKSYTHKYFLAMNDDTDDTDAINEPSVKRAKKDESDPEPALSRFQRSEVSNLEWFTYEKCLQMIRPYNKEKLRMMHNVHEIVEKYAFCATKANAILK